MRKFLSTLSILLLAVLTVFSPFQFSLQQGKILPSLETKTARATSTISSYVEKKQITYDTSANGANITTNQNYFPITIHINSLSWPVGTERNIFFGTYNNQSGHEGKRIQFFDYDQTTNLPYEVEYYSNSNQEAIYWVRIPTVYQSGDANYSSHHFIWVAYGNDADGTDYHGSYGSYVAQQNDVWSENGANNFAMVQHMGDNSWLTSPEAKDSTSNSFNGTNSGTTDVAGQAREGRSFNGTTITVNDNTKLKQNGDFSYSFWIKGTADGGYRGIMRYGPGNNADSYYVYHDNSYIYYKRNNWQDPLWHTVTSTLAYVSMTFSNTSKYLTWYYNGSLDHSPTYYPYPTNNGVNNLVFGQGDSVGLIGVLDEIRLSNSLRSADWIKLEYYSMQKTNYNGDNGAGSGKFITFGSQQGASYNSIFQTSDTDFTGTNSQTAVSGTGTGASVGLANDGFSCGTSTVSYSGLTYGTVSANSKCWLDRNLGATQVATAYNDSNAYGWYFQWGRSVDGHQIYNSGTTTTLCSTCVSNPNGSPGHGNYIFVSFGTYDWCGSTQNNNYWQSASSYANNACPTNWHVPTQPEWASVISACSITDYNTAISNSCGLKIPAAGHRLYTNGTMDHQGNTGYYWTATPYTINAYHLSIYSSSINTADNDARAAGNSVRCVKNVPGAIYSSSGTYTSPVIQRAQLVSWGNLNYNATLNSQSLGIKVRTCSQSNCSDGTAWASCGTIASGASLTSGSPNCVSNSQPYIQYQANFISDGTNTAYLNDITLDYFYNPDTTIMSGVVKFFGNITFK